MGTSTENKATAKKTRQRRRIIEKFYLAGYGPLEIHDKLETPYRVTYGTVRKDIVEIRDAWKSDVDEADEFEGRHRYLASLREVRDKAITGWEEEGKFGPMIKGIDLALVHKIDRDIAQLSGVDLKINERTININLQAAITHMEVVLSAVFSVIPDQSIQGQIIEAIEIAADE